jgi:D-arabinose 1-dehydrogenase-like Zn-dependent alcohol dehydrogenase
MAGKNNVCPKQEGLYDPYFGGYSTHIQLKARGAFRVPAGLRIEVASPLLCAGVTVYAPLKRWYKPNDTCAVLGIGGLGHLAV